MARVRTWGVLLVLVLGTTGLIARQAHTGADDPVIGVWELDTAHSQYIPGPAPMSETRTYEFGHEGIRATIVTTDAQGVAREVQYEASYNDVVTLVTGSKEVDAIRMRRLNDTTAEATLSYQGRPVGTARRVIAADGRSMTITFRRVAPTPLNNVAVYRRVQTTTR